MFYFPLKTRRAARSQRQRSTPRPRLEGLEERLVPALPADGTILIANYHDDRTDSNVRLTGEPPVPVGILGVYYDFGTSQWRESKIAINGITVPANTFERPNYITQKNSSTLFVTDLTANGGGSVFQVTLSATSNPVVSLLASYADDPWLQNPTTIAYVNGMLYVTDAGPASALGQMNLIRIDPNQPHVVNHINNDLVMGYSWYDPNNPNSGLVKCVVGLEPVPGDTQDLYLADEGGNFPFGIGPGTIYKIPVSSGSLSTIISGSSNPYKGGDYFDARYNQNRQPPNYALGNMQGLAVKDGGQTLYAPQGGSQGLGASLIGVDPTTGTQTVLAQDPAMLSPFQPKGPSVYYVQDFTAKVQGMLARWN